MRTTADETSLLHLKEVARELDVSTATLRRRIAAGELDAVQLGGRGPLRIRRDALESFLTPARADR